jgi:hypothetical protein
MLGLLVSNKAAPALYPANLGGWFKRLMTFLFRR